MGDFWVAMLRVSSVACLADATCEGHVQDILACKTSSDESQCMLTALESIITSEETSGVDTAEANLHTCMDSIINSICATSSASDSGLSRGAIVGITLGCLVACGCLIGGASAIKVIQSSRKSDEYTDFEEPIGIEAEDNAVSGEV